VSQRGKIIGKQMANRATSTKLGSGRPWPRHVPLITDEESLSYK